MLEPWRSQYLRALGVDVYLPRVVLPGARASVACEWDWSVEATVDQATPVTAAEPPVTEHKAAAVAAVVMESPVTSVQERMPAIEERAKVRREPAAQTTVRAKEGAAIPQFALSVVTTDSGALIVDEAPPKSVARGEYLRLLSNLIFALQGGAATPVLDVFIWPMVKNNPQIDQSAEAAREAIAAYLQKQIHSRSARTLLLLGDSAQHWLPEAARAQLDVTCALSISGWQCLADPKMKRQMWQDLRHLAVSGR